MTASTFTPGLAVAAAFAVAGLAFGFAYFAALRRTVDLYGAGRGPLVLAALTLGRIGSTIVFFGFTARFGALPLLAAFIGFLFARVLVLGAVRKAG